MNVTIERGVEAPADIMLIPKAARPSGRWWRFETDHAHAMVFTSHGEGVVPSAFLLHWIESGAKGRGTALMLAIGNWADLNDLWGSLICHPNIAGFYHQFGWDHRTYRAIDAVVMERPIGARPRKEFA